MGKEMERRDFFLSYNHPEDLQWALWIAETLVIHGYTVYVQAWENPPQDKNVVDWINDAMEATKKGFIAVWSSTYKASNWCRREFDAGYQQKLEGEIELFLTMRTENEPIGPMRRHYAKVDLFGKDEAQAQHALLRAIGHRGMPLPRGRFPGNSESGQSTPPPPNPFPNGSGNGSSSGAQSDKEADTQVKQDLTSRLTEPNPDVITIRIPRIKPRVWKRALVALLIIVAFIGAGLLVSPVFRGLINFWQGNYYYQSASYSTALDFYRAADKAGNADATERLGWMYQNGLGTSVNLQEAQKAYERAAEKGSALAFTRLGDLRYASADYESAKAYYESAAKKEEGDALWGLGNLYYYGYGVELNRETASSYYEQSSDQGNPRASFNLGYMYYHADGVERDYDKAKTYFERAEKGEIPEAMTYLGLIYEFGYGRISKNLGKAEEYYTKAINAGENEYAQQNLNRLWKKLENQKLEN